MRQAARDRSPRDILAPRPRRRAAAPPAEAGAHRETWRRIRPSPSASGPPRQSRTSTVPVERAAWAPLQSPSAAGLLSIRSTHDEDPAPAMGARSAAGPRAPAARPRSASASAPAWCAPMLLMYYLCCWPDSKSDTSSEKNQSRRSTIKHESGSRRSSHLFGHRFGSSAVSLHLPTTSGSKKEPLSGHRSHEEIGRRKSHHELTAEEAAHYHSAPSVIDEVIHRRDWDRSARELHIPLRPETLDARSISSDSLETTPPEETGEHKKENQIVGRPCKKHYTNIKSSKGKEKQVEEDKDCDAKEVSTFYIGDNDASGNNSPRREDLLARSIYKAKEAKQSFNESIRTKERPRRALAPLQEGQPRVFGFCLDDVIDQLESLDRSGAEHHSIESRVSLSKPAYPPPSVEPAGYECFLPEGAEGRRGQDGALRAPAARTLRGRHASDGDILGPPQRPESGAFSESDVDLELEGAHEPPPAYDQLSLLASPKRKETAI